MKEVFIFLLALAILHHFFGEIQHQYAGRATLNAPVTEQVPQNANADLGAIAASKDVAAKIAGAAPLVIEALKECPRPIPPEMITAFWARENDYCAGTPIKKCNVSVAGAIGPTQIMPFNIVKFGKPGEDPETLAVGLKMTVRHLCFAKGKGDRMLDPTSDEAILRYNNNNDYLKDIRRFQAQHAPIWASIRSGNGPVIVSNAGTVEKPLPPGCVRTPRGNAFCTGPGNNEMKLLPTVPLTRHATWISAWGDRRNHDGVIVPHGGIDAGCSTTGEPLVAACDGTVVTAMPGVKRAGSMVAIECTGWDEKVTVEHMDSIGVSQGQTVTAHQQIGTCGHTGNAEPKPGEMPAPHGHIQLAVRDGGNGWKNVNPCNAPAPFASLKCGELLFGPETRFNPIHDVGGPIASN